MKRFLQLLVGGMVVLIVLMGLHLHRLPHGRLVFDFLDIGQGDGILITTPDQHHILVDGGPEQFVLEELGESLPFLHRTLDLVVLTHPHADHVMGLVPVLERYSVKRVLFSGVNYESPIYDAFLNEIRERDIPLEVARASQDWRLPFKNGGEIVFDVLYPFESLLGDHRSNVNNASVVMKVMYGPHKILLTGDAELEVESELVATDLDLSAHLLKAGHHGSRTSSSWEFLKRVNPEIVVIQCGTDNPFGHPHPETLEKLQDLDVEVRRNDLEGRIRIMFNDQFSMSK